MPIRVTSHRQVIYTIKAQRPSFLHRSVSPSSISLARTLPWLPLQDHHLRAISHSLGESRSARIPGLKSVSFSVGKGISSLRSRSLKVSCAAKPETLEKVEIEMGLEEEFGISVEVESAQSIATVQDTADFIERLIEKKRVIEKN